MSYNTSNAVRYFNSHGQFPARNYTTPPSPAFSPIYSLNQAPPSFPVPYYNNNFQYRRCSKTITSYPNYNLDLSQTILPAPYYPAYLPSIPLTHSNYNEKGLSLILVAILILLALDLIIVRPMKYGTD